MGGAVDLCGRETTSDRGVCVPGRTSGGGPRRLTIATGSGAREPWQRSGDRPTGHGCPRRPTAPAAAAGGRRRLLLRALLQRADAGPAACGTPADHW